jgi:hypothetical protein
MSAAILGQCPGCKRTLRLPEQAAGQTVRCRHCGMVSHANPTPRLLALQAAAKAAPVAAPVMTAAPAAQAPQGVDAWSAIADEAFNEATPARRYRRGKGGWVAAILALFFLAACLAGTAAAVYFILPTIKEKIAERDQAQKSTPETDKVAAVGNQDKPFASAGTHDFPRRLLGISVNNYIYANPTSYGFDNKKYVKRDFGKTLEKLANRFRIPDSQVFELSDCAPKQPNPPVKPIIEQTLTRFVETSRPQDRVIVILCAHTIEIDKKPYLVPLEGDLEDAKTLIPVEWVMQQLDKCPAQQKVLIADFNRYDRGRGKERPHGGKLAESTEALLKNPPAGVQVWSASSAGQYSYEFDDDYAFDNQAVRGGAFLNMFSVVFLAGGAGGKIQKPDDPLPIDLLAQKVNPLTEKLSTELEDPDGDPAEAMPEKTGDKKEQEKQAKVARKKALQTPFLAGSMKGEPAAFNPSEPAPKPVVIPTPQEVYAKGVVPQEQIKKMLDIFAVPPIKEARIGASEVRFDRVLPFQTEVMKDYMNNTTVEQIKSDSEKYPLRAAVISAIETLRKLDSADMALPTSLTEGDRNDAAKNKFAKDQRAPARVILQLGNVIEALQKAGEERKEEKSKFWQATFDYVMAQAKARYVYTNEYDSVVGLIRKDNLPDLDKKKGQAGWRLASKESLTTSDNDVKEMRKDVRKIYLKLAKDHPGTPWAVLAKREKDATLGLRWEPYGEATKEQPEPAADKK